MKRLLVSGCGGHGIAHIQAAQPAGFVLCGVFDPMPARMEEAIETGGNPNAIAFGSMDALLESKADALVITSLDELHADQMLGAVERGIPVLVDKPLAVDRAQMATVRQALRLAGRNNVVVTSCLPRRFDPPYAWVAANLQRLVARFGELIRIELDFSYHAPTAEWKFARSLLKDHFTHEVDYLRLLMGGCTVSARTINDSHDKYCVAGQLDDTVAFVCSGTRMLERRDFPEEIRLRFAHGSYTANTETGVATLHDHELQMYGYEIAGKTDHTRRIEGVMKDFSRMIDGEPGALTPIDLEINTDITVMLSTLGVFPR